MRINLIDKLLTVCSINQNSVTVDYVIRRLPFDKTDIFYTMDEMINTIGGEAYCMQFEVSYKFKKQYGFPNHYNGIPIKSSPATTKKIIILKPFLL